MSFSDFLSCLFVPIGFGVLFRAGWFFADTIGEAFVIIANKLLPRKHPKN